MANMAVDSWFPKKFAALSERLTMRNGVLVMGIAALILMISTNGDIFAPRHNVCDQCVPHILTLTTRDGKILNKNQKKERALDTIPAHLRYRFYSLFYYLDCYYL